MRKFIPDIKHIRCGILPNITEGSLDPCPERKELRCVLQVQILVCIWVRDPGIDLLKGCGKLLTERCSCKLTGALLLWCKLETAKFTGILITS